MVLQHGISYTVIPEISCTRKTITLNHGINNAFILKMLVMVHVDY